MLALFDELQKVATHFAVDAIPGPVIQKTAEHPIWPHHRSAMTDPDAIRLRLTADVLTARAACGYVDQAHQVAFGWTEGPARCPFHFRRQRTGAPVPADPVRRRAHADRRGRPMSVLRRIRWGNAAIICACLGLDTLVYRNLYLLLARLIP